MEQVVTVKVNGRTYERSVPLRMLLVDFLREELRLTGTHIGCTYEGRCGACTIALDGDAVKSCMMLAVQADGRDVTTVEGLEKLGGNEGELHPIQDAMSECHGLQCGYCTPGMMMTMFDLLRSQSYESESRLTEDEIRHELIGNLCRCTGYDHIVNAVRAAEERLHAMPGAERAALLGQGDIEGKQS